MNKYYEANRDRVLAQVKAWQANNGDKLREYRKANVKKFSAARKRAYNDRGNNPQFFNGEPVSTAEVSYIGAHKRLVSYRGFASRYECAACYEQAKQWAHNHSQNEHTRTELKKNRSGGLVPMDYSLSVWDYLALCVSCHNKFDRFGYLLHDYEVAA